MTYLEFVSNTPVLYGQITVNDKSKIGTFKPLWNKYSNSLCYAYHTPKGRKGSGGFTLKKAYDLFNTNNLSIDPQMGLPENYV